MKLVVLGATGMLGSMVLERMAADDALELVATARDAEGAPPECERRVEWRRLDAEDAAVPELEDAIAGARWVVNAIGVIKPYIRDHDASQVRRAILVNALFPHRLAEAAHRVGARVLQIATDCVYSGRCGRYAEEDAHDAEDVYGKTKSLGEVRSSAVHHLRCSIVGPERRRHVSLFDWFLRQPEHAAVDGYKNHAWNGVTTLQFARLCHGIVRHDLDLPHLLHVVPADAVSKAELLGILARSHGRTDVAIRPVEARGALDRTLATSDPRRNEEVWRAAGYTRIPTVEEMVEELARSRPGRRSPETAEGAARA